MATIAAPGFYRFEDWRFPISTTVAIPGVQVDASGLGGFPNVMPLNNTYWRSLLAGILPDAVAVRPGAFQLNGSFGRRRGRRFASPAVV